MISSALAKYPLDYIDEFEGDFIQLIRMALELDKELGVVDERATRNLPVYKKYVELFNNKYSGLVAKFKESNTEPMLRLFIRNEKSVKRIFDEVIAKVEPDGRVVPIIEGLDSIGSDILEMDNIKDKREFILEYNMMKSKLYVQYCCGKESIFLKYSKDADMVEIIYDPLQLIKMHSHSSTFIICCYYALRGEWKHGLDIRGASVKFSSSVSASGNITGKPLK
ncbi:MAG: hypothetical protein Q7J54_02625 [Candidatus Woesearchaeota archaeon]|nr:hypothetical protein [Candidatus Woesearchaeota archaeon]